MFVYFEWVSSYLFSGSLTARSKLLLASKQTTDQQTHMYIHVNLRANQSVKIVPEDGVASPIIDTILCQAFWTSSLASSQIHVIVMPNYCGILWVIPTYCCFLHANSSDVWSLLMLSLLQATSVLGGSAGFLPSIGSTQRY